MTSISTRPARPPRPGPQSLLGSLLGRADPHPLRPVSPADGHDPGELRRWCADGALLWVAADVYLPVDVAGTPLARQLAVARATGRVGVLTGAASVWCRGGPGLPRREPVPRDDPRARLELLVPAGSSRAQVPQVRQRRCAVPREATERLGPLRVTTPDRCALDLARWGHGPDDDAALAWLWAHGASASRTVGLLRRESRTPGNLQARLVLGAVRRGHPHPLTELVEPRRRAPAAGSPA